MPRIGSTAFRRGRGFIAVDSRRVHGESVPGVFCTPPMAMPKTCPHCGFACFLEVEDGQPACWGCGWRPQRKPSAAERGECEPLPGRDRRRGPSIGGIRL